MEAVCRGDESGVTNGIKDMVVSNEVFFVECRVAPLWQGAVGVSMKLMMELEMEFVMDEGRFFISKIMIDTLPANQYIYDDYLWF